MVSYLYIRFSMPYTDLQSHLGKSIMPYPDLSPVHCRSFVAHTIITCMNFVSVILWWSLHIWESCHIALSCWSIYLDLSCLVPWPSIWLCSYGPLLPTLCISVPHMINSCPSIWLCSYGLLLQTHYMTVLNHLLLSIYVYDYVHVIYPCPL